MSKLAIDSNSKPIQVLRPDVTYTVNVSGSAASATAIANGRVARIVCTTPVFYTVSGTADISDVYLPAESVEYIHVYEGDVISLVTSGTTGVAYVTEMV